MNKVITSTICAALMSTGCHKSDPMQLLKEKQDHIIKTLNAWKYATGLPPDLNNCVLTLIGKKGEQVQLSLACDGKLLIDKKRTPEKSSWSFVTQILEIKREWGTFQWWPNTCITIEDTGLPASTCPDTDDGTPDTGKPKLTV